MTVLKYVRLTILRRCYSNKSTSIMKYLNVAEKNDAAKNIAGFLSRGSARRREGLSKFNKIYEFETNLFNQNVKMVMTSVSGHLLNYAFTSNFKNWSSCNPVALFDATMVKVCMPDYEPIKKTLEREIQSCTGLIIWTDCDREGENIGFEIIKVCRDKKPNIRVYRAKFSEITAVSCFRALNNLGEPDQNVSNAVDVRAEMDLRTGAAFTRLQTLHLGKIFPGKLADKLISYGSCQFPTLGFVVDRYKDVESFIPEPFWKIKMSHTIKELTVDFTWFRERLFAEMPCRSILEICQENPTATVESVNSKPKSKWRPVPLDTVEMEKTVSRKLKINAKETMRIAERLYTQGFISYPRTETNIFPKELNLQTLVEQQTADPTWGAFANRILNEGGPNPRQGKKSDQAHPPIHPTKHAPNLQGNEKRLYEYIVRHFLACCHKDAVGHETIIKVNIADERFTAKGLIILERNYLDVYVYEKWSGKEVHNYRQGETFTPTVLEMAEGSTTAPQLLTEADLISMMEKCGIGTDATHADHIDTIKSREYVGLHENKFFVPGTLGMGLVEGYDSIGLEISLAKPILRSEFEKDLKLICDGRKDPQIVLREQIQKYKTMFENVVAQMRQLEEKLANRIEEQRANVEGMQLPTENNFRPILKCPKCNNVMVLRKRKNETGYFISCVGFPACRNAIWLPGFVENVETLDESCQTCGPDVKKIKMKFRTGQNPFFGENPKILCIGGCDNNVLDTLTIAQSSVMKTNQPPSYTQNNPTNNPPRTFNNTNNSTRINTQNNTNNAANNSWTRPSNSQNNSSSATRRNNSDSGVNSWTRPSNSQNNPSSTARRNNSDSGYNTWIQPNSALVNSTMMNRTVPLNTTITNNSRNNTRVPSVDVGDILCNCGEPAVQLTVRKDGPNKGRLFYKCNKRQDEGGCNYFLWAPDDGSTPQQSSSNTTLMTPPSFNAPSTSFAPPTCNCGQPAIERVVQKEGPNKGKTFHVCPNGPQNKCNFFKWSDDSNSGGASGGGNWGNSSFSGGNSWNNRGGTRSRGRGSGTKRKAPSTRNTGTGAKSRRKCGLCGEEGHNRTNCPNNGND